MLTHIINKEIFQQFEKMLEILILYFSLKNSRQNRNLKKIIALQFNEKFLH